MSVDVTGLQEAIKMFDELDRKSADILKDAVKDGINVVTDEMRSQIFSLKTSDEYQGGNGKRYPSKNDVQGLLDSLGYTPTKTQGAIINAKCGFDGYNKNVTKKYPRGHANQMIANAINKGTSFLIAQPFINRTKNKSQQACIDTMEKSITKGIESADK